MVEVRDPSKSCLQVTRRAQLGLKVKPDAEEAEPEPSHEKGKKAQAKGKATAKAHAKAKAAAKETAAKAKVSAKAKACQSAKGGGDQANGQSPPEIVAGDDGDGKKPPVEGQDALRRLGAASNLEESMREEEPSKSAKSKRPKDGSEVQDEEPRSKRGRRPAGEGPQSFARRVQPATELGSLKWRYIREAFIDHIKPHLIHYSSHEAGACVRSLGWSKRERDLSS